MKNKSVVTLSHLETLGKHSYKIEKLTNAVVIMAPTGDKRVGDYLTEDEALGLVSMPKVEVVVIPRK